MNRDEKYLDPEKVLVRQLRLNSGVLADSLFVVVEKTRVFSGYFSQTSERGWL